MNSNSTWLCVALMAMSLQISRGADFAQGERT